MTLTIKRLILCSSLALGLCSFSTTYAEGTPDGSTPAQETFCDNPQFKGKVKGLCIAYCEANDCDSTDPNADPDRTACSKLETLFTQAGTDAEITNIDFAQCQEIVTCPCGDLNPESGFNIPSVGPTSRTCSETQSDRYLILSGSNGFLCSKQGNGVQAWSGSQLTIEEANACVAELRMLGTGCSGLPPFTP